MSIYLTPGNWRMRRMLTSGHAGLLQGPEISLAVRTYQLSALKTTAADAVCLSLAI